jgi:hypothetical protein
MITEHRNNKVTIPPDVFGLLAKQTQNCEEMLVLLSDEKKALMIMDTSALLSLSRMKEQQLSLIQALDGTLTKTAENIAQTFDLPAAGLSGLAPHLPPEEAKKLSRVRKELLHLQEEILSRNLLNKKFAQETKNFLGDAISLITGAMRQDQGYTTRGLNRSSKNQPSFISREV